MEENKFVCEKCSKEVRGERCEVGSENWCSSCRDTHALDCDQCGDYYPRSKMEIDAYSAICNDCIARESADIDYDDYDNIAD